MFDAVAPLNALRALVDQLSDVSTAGVYTGWPASIVPAYAVIVALRTFGVLDKATRLAEWAPEYAVVLAYRVAGQPANAELKLAAWMAEFTNLWLADRTLGGSCRSSTIIPSPADPAYLTIGNQEFRVLPLTVTVQQQRAF